MSNEPVHYSYGCAYCSLVIPYGGYNQTQDQALTKMLEHLETHDECLL